MLQFVRAGAATRTHEVQLGGWRQETTRRLAHDVQHVSQAAAPAIFHLEHAALAEGVTRAREEKSGGGEER